MKDLKKALKNGEIVMGVCSDISDPSVVEVLGYSGWDFVIINCEGGTTSLYGTELENMIRAAYLADIYPIVKVPKNDPSMIATALNFGAKTLEIPKVSTKEDAIAAIKAAKYPPQGDRSGCWGIPATKYGIVPWPEFLQRTEEEVCIWAVLESKEALANMKDILSVKGLDIVSIGPLDTALRLGGVGNPEAEEQVKKYQKRCAELCRESGVFMLRSVRDVESAKEAIRWGCRVLLLSYDDYRLLYSASKDWEEKLREVVNQSV
jgi:4-hydroxy-2-oxoheptanedioate aldolase